MITLICGRIGCGKTHYAHRLDGEKISIDAVMLERYPPYLGDAHERIAAAVKAELLEKAAQTEGDVVLDWGFWTRADRAATRKYFEARGKSTRLIWIDLPEKELERRRQYRNENLPPDAYYIDENLARKCDTTFEPPLPEEYEIRITE